MGNQEALLEEIADLEIPFIIDIMSSKPVILPDRVIDAASVIFQQFSPGMLGGLAFANALAGVVNPSGRLPISIPYHTGQLPVYYNQIKGQHGQKYVDLPQDPRWAFGYGRSYSKFEYHDASLDKAIYGKEDLITLTMAVKNSGPYNGTEIVQIYVADLVTSVTWATQELKAFRRVQINVDEDVKLVFTVKASDCSIVNAEGFRVVEPGDFEIRIGRASNKIVFALPFTIA
jgi:beta-glucosidase